MSESSEISIGLTPDKQKTPNKLQRFMYRKIMGSVIRRSGVEPHDVYGLLDGSIIGSRLCHPDQSIGALVYKESWNQHWHGYDFIRAIVFSGGRRPVERHMQGSLRTYMLDEIAGRDADVETPIGLFDPLNLDHVLKQASPSPDELVDLGMLTSTTHAEAYDYVGMSEYIPDLRARGVADEPVYQVTPKGSTLIDLVDPAEGANGDHNYSNRLRKLQPIKDLS